MGSLARTTLPAMRSASVRALTSKCGYGRWYSIMLWLSFWLRSSLFSPSCANAENLLDVPGGGVEVRKQSHR